ncbi:hypothetical protein HMPREF9123_1592 [Neisseria bacilliformis ATCC BAA-1200]|uniref:Uncharacterized protein n=1 Tax=Neisseria bacilliformis ATCC BAA-1200 TaxID=888742 RepID=F2BCW2_9NEIS|nr:hypothetical protein HMPREF9123_1592 [Neisseria bacilliformis ATCC BAA-1200]
MFEIIKFVILYQTKQIQTFYKNGRKKPLYEKFNIFSDFT